MADIHKITKNGETILPATTTDAIVHPQMETSLTNMINEYNVSKLFPTGGVDGGDTYTLEGAIALLNSKLTASQKTVGIKLAFKDNGSENNDLVEYQYSGYGEFNNVNSWYIKIANELGSGENSAISQKVTTEADRFLKVEISSTLCELNDSYLLPLFGLYYSSTNNKIAYKNKLYDGYCMKVREGETYTVKGINVINSALFDEYPALDTEPTSTNIQILDNQFTVPEGIKYIVFSVAIDNITSEAGIYPVNKIVYQDEVDNFVTSDQLETFREIDRLYFHNSILKQGWIDSVGIISQTQWENCYSFLIGVKEGDVVGYTNGYQYAFLTDDIEFVNGKTAPLVEDTSRIQSSNETSIIIPATCKYIWISGQFTSDNSTVFDYQPDTITINGVSYNFGNDKNAKIPNLPERVDNLDNETGKTSYPKGILKYTASNKTFQFFMYKGISNQYFSITMQLKIDNSDEVYLNEYRWVDGGLYSYSNRVFSREASTVSYMENEMAIKFNNSTDYTGGVHGDERIDIDPNSFAKFFADGQLLSDTDLNTDFEKECSEFSYIQYSTLHETDGITEKEATSHPIIAHHLKHNIFKDCASFLDNTVKFDVDDYDYSNLYVDQYHAIIMCIDKESAAVTLLPDFVVADTSKGDNGTTIANNFNNATVIQWNEEKGTKVITEGHFTEGLSDDMKNNPDGTPVYSVWDRPQDSKIYRRYHNINKQVAKGYVIRNHQEVHFS